MYCFCQKENTGWYLECDVKHPGCLVYYHAKCVGLDDLKSAEDGEALGNYRDGEYRCPKCFHFDEKKKAGSVENVENALDEIYFRNLSEQEGNLVMTSNIKPNSSETPANNSACGSTSDISSDAGEIQSPTDNCNDLGDVNDNGSNNGIQQETKRELSTISDNEDLEDVYCFCQQENTGWYLECDVKHPGSLVYYHAKCVGLDDLKSVEDGKAFSNYRDGEYRCPKCVDVDEKNKAESMENVENALDEIYFSNLSEQEGNLVITSNVKPNSSETSVVYQTHRQIQAKF